MLKLKLKLVGANAKCKIYEASGSPEAIAQYVKDQAEVVKGDGNKGATISESGAPLVFRKSSILTEITRNDNGWFSDNTLSKELETTVAGLRAAGNDQLADYLLKEQASEIMASIKASVETLKNRPAYVKPAVEAGLDKA